MFVKIFHLLISYTVSGADIPRLRHFAHMWWQRIPDKKSGPGLEVEMRICYTY